MRAAYASCRAPHAASFAAASARPVVVNQNSAAGCRADDPDAIDVVVPTIGLDGFPNDEFFYDSVAPFTQTSEQGTMSGLLRVRHLPPQP
jgi:hypothetical protein